MNAQTVLVVDDDDAFRVRLVRALADRGYDARGAASANDALAAARVEPPELAVVDLRLQPGSGLDVVTGLLAVEPATRVVVLTGYGSIATAVDALHRGAVHYLTKPADADDVVRAFAGPGGDGSAASDDRAPSLARVEWEHIQRVMKDADNNISLAARRLGLHRRSLQRKLQKDPVPR